MDNDKKEGVSVKEIENFAKKHRFEVFFCLAFVLACFFAFVMYSPWWSLLAATVGGVVGVLAPTKVTSLAKGIMQFLFKQEHTTQLVLGIALMIVAIFLSPVIFLILGLHGGKDLYHMAMEMHSNQPR